MLHVGVRPLAPPRLLRPHGAPDATQSARARAVRGGAQPAPSPAAAPGRRAIPRSSRWLCRAPRRAMRRRIYHHGDRSRLAGHSCAVGATGDAPRRRGRSTAPRTRRPRRARRLTPEGTRAGRAGRRAERAATNIVSDWRAVPVRLGGLVGVRTGCPHSCAHSQRSGRFRAAGRPGFRSRGRLRTFLRLAAGLAPRGVPGD